eukprot:1138012-Pelagomonas_calceolata.AAC.6
MQLYPIMACWQQRKMGGQKLQSTECDLVQKLHGPGSIAHHHLLWPESRELQTVYEEDFGRCIADVTYFHGHHPDHQANLFAPFKQDLGSYPQSLVVQTLRLLVIQPIYDDSVMHLTHKHVTSSMILQTDATTTFMFLTSWGGPISTHPYPKLLDAYPHGEGLTSAAHWEAPPSPTTLNYATPPSGSTRKSCSRATRGA